MSAIVINGDTSGSVTLQAPAVAGATTLNLQAASGTLAPIVSGTAVASTSGTSIDFTGIPSWAKRVTVIFNGVSTTGGNSVMLQLGSGTVQTTGYLGSGNRVVNAAATAGVTYTAGFGLPIAAATYDLYGHITVTNISGNVWVASGTLSITSAVVNLVTAGSVTLTGTLDRVRLTTLTGVDTFDAGSINILWE